MIWDEDCGYCTREDCRNAFGKDHGARVGFSLASDGCAVQCNGCHTRLIVCECCGALTDDDCDEEAHGVYCRMCGFLNLTGDARDALSRNLLRCHPIDETVIVCFMNACRCLSLFCFHVNSLFSNCRLGSKREGSLVTEEEDNPRNVQD